MTSEMLNGSVTVIAAVKRAPYGLEVGHRFPGTRLTVVRFMGLLPHGCGMQPMPVRPTFLVRCDCGFEFTSWLKPITWSHELTSCYSCHRKLHTPPRADCKECRCIFAGETL